MIPILVLAPTWLAGIFLYGWLKPPVQGLYFSAALCLVTGLAGLAYARSRPVPAKTLAWPLVLLALSVTCLGGLRLSWDAPSTGPDGLLYYHEQPGTILTGLISAEPLYNSRSGTFRVDAREIRLEGMGENVPVNGAVYVRAPAVLEVKRGDLVRLTGTLTAPREISGEDFPYRDWLERQGIYTTMDFPRLTLLATDQDFFLARWFYRLNEQARQVVARFVPGEEGGLLSGILLGDKSGLSLQTRQDFTTSGLAHMLAVSGSNISIAIFLTTQALSRFVGRRTLIWLTLGVVLFYVLLVGFSPAVLRAGLMGGMALVGMLLGREYTGLAGLAGSALILTLWQPSILMDTGFQLSFMATLGLVLFSPAWQQPVRSWPLFLKTSLAGTLAAEAMILPLVIFYFHQVSLISVLANLLVLPVIEIIMVLGGLAVGSGLLLSWFSWPTLTFGGLTWLFLAYILVVVKFCASLPFASVHIPVFNPVWIFIYYLVLSGLLGWHRLGDTNRLKGKILHFAGSGAGLATAFLLALGIWTAVFIV